MGASPSAYAKNRAACGPLRGGGSPQIGTTLTASHSVTSRPRGGKGDRHCAARASADPNFFKNRYGVLGGASMLLLLCNGVPTAAAYGEAPNHAAYKWTPSRECHAIFARYSPR